MITVLGMWEDAWMEAERTERRLWKQTIQAFEVDTWGMCPTHGGPFTSPIQYDDLASMLAAHSGPKTFLIPAGRVEDSQSLREYEHPEDAIYVFGNSPENLVGYVDEDDDVVTIDTPSSQVLFAPVVLSVVLYDRMAKRVVG